MWGPLKRMECHRCNSWGRGDETSKWQWVNSKLVSFRSGFWIHKLNRCNSWGRGGETSKWQWVDSKLVSFQSGFRIHKLNFEIILKWPSSLVQLFSNGHNFFISALICKPFEVLDFWLPKIQNDIYYVYNGLH